MTDARTAADEVRTAISDFLRSHTGVGTIDDSTDLLGAGRLDSLDFLQLVSLLEDRFAIEIDFSDVDPEQLTRVEGLVQLVVAARED